MPLRAFIVLNLIHAWELMFGRGSLNALAGIYCFERYHLTEGHVQMLSLNALAGIYCFEPEENSPNQLHPNFGLNALAGIYCFEHSSVLRSSGKPDWS